MGVMHDVEGHVSPIIALLYFNTLGIGPRFMSQHREIGLESWQGHHIL